MCIRANHIKFFDIYRICDLSKYNLSTDGFTISWNSRTCKDFKSNISVNLIENVKIENFVQNVNICHIASHFLSCLICEAFHIESLSVFDISNSIKMYFLECNHMIRNK